MTTHISYGLKDLLKISIFGVLHQIYGYYIHCVLLPLPTKWEEPAYFQWIHLLLFVCLSRSKTNKLFIIGHIFTEGVYPWSGPTQTSYRLVFAMHRFIVSFCWFVVLKVLHNIFMNIVACSSFFVLLFRVHNHFLTWNDKLADEGPATFWHSSTFCKHWCIKTIHVAALKSCINKIKIPSLKTCKNLCF